MLNLPLELPLEDAPQDDLAAQRRHHAAFLTAAGIDNRQLIRLMRSFPSLSALYSASYERLKIIVGPVAAARLRWFLDAPLEANAPEASMATVAVPTPSPSASPAPQSSLSNAA